MTTVLFFIVVIEPLERVILLFLFSKLVIASNIFVEYANRFLRNDKRHIIVLLCSGIWRFDFSVTHNSKYLASNFFSSF